MTVTPYIAIAGLFEIAIFLILAGLHFFWAFGGHPGNGVAVPEKDGRPLFRPGKGITILVAFALLSCSVVIAGRIWLFGDQPYLLAFKIGTIAIGIVFALRAIGDFRYVGFLKRYREGRFARWDYLLFSPLCTLISAVSFVLACN